MLQKERDHLATPLDFGTDFIVILIPGLLHEAYAAMLNDELGVIDRTS